MLTLTPQARAIASLALGFAVVAGYLDRLGFAVATVVNGARVNTTPKTDSVLIEVVTGLVAILVFTLGRQATAELDGWARGAGQAGQLLALVGLAIAAITLLGVIIDGHIYPTSLVAG